MKPATWRETAVFAAIALVGVTVQIALMGAYGLITRPLWFDECLTWLLATDGSFVHEMRALAGGADTNMPGLYVMLWPMAWAGLVTAEGLRWWSLVWTVAAMTLTYGYLRTFARREVAAVGALVLWSHPLVMGHAFEARFYAPMLAAAAGVGWALAARSRVGLAIAALVLCGAHYFGVIVLGLMIAGAIVSGQRSWRELCPAGAGVLATMACLPFYFGQRASFTATDWMEGLGSASIATFLHEVFPIGLWLIFVLALAWWFSRGGDGTNRPPWPLLALLAMPLVLLVISLASQPVLMGRYAIVVALALATGVCWLLRHAPRVMMVLVGLALVALSSWNLHRLHEFQMMAAARMALIADGIERAPAGMVVFESGFDALPATVAGVQGARILEAPLAGGEFSRKADVVRGQVKNVMRWYPEGAPRWVSREELLRDRAFVYVRWETAAEALPPGYAATALNPIVSVVERRD